MPMSWLSCSIPKPERWRGGSGLWVLLLLALLAAGCSVSQKGAPMSGGLGDGVSTVLYVHVGIPDDRAYLASGQQDITQTFRQIERDYRRINPGVRFVMQTYPEGTLGRELRRRNASGLGPDLLLLSNATALRLANAGLIRPLTLPAKVARQLGATTLGRTRLSDGSLAGLPVMQQAQLACFNAARLKQPPSDLDQLLQVSAASNQVGLAIDPQGVYWTAGSLGASDALIAAA
jgi:arabinogalactan oligomer / maltooligosaccharide transport system substrate-binding protein